MLSKYVRFSLIKFSPRMKFFLFFLFFLPSNFSPLFAKDERGFTDVGDDKVILISRKII